MNFFPQTSHHGAEVSVADEGETEVAEAVVVLVEIEAFLPGAVEALHQVAVDEGVIEVAPGGVAGEVAAVEAEVRAVIEVKMFCF